MYVVISYDIVVDRQRNRAAKILLDYLTRVQYSVFEGRITAEHLAELQTKLEALLDPETDSLRIYFLCERCKDRIYTYGQEKLIEMEHMIIS